MADFLRTDDVAEADRFTQWRHWISATFVPLECAQVRREPFRGEVGHRGLGDMLVSRVEADPHLAARTRRTIALRDVGYYKVGLLTKGSCRLSQEDRQALLHPIEVSATGASPNVAARLFEARIPLSRHACPEEIARCVLFLACADSSFVTGATLAVDGGMHI